MHQCSEMGYLSGTTAIVSIDKNAFIPFFEF